MIRSPAHDICGPAQGGSCRKRLPGIYLPQKNKARHGIWLPAWSFFLICLSAISIHTSVWNATSITCLFMLYDRVSIYASVWGATDSTQLFRRRRYFNPRTCMECDEVPACVFRQIRYISIHAPVWGATYRSFPHLTQLFYYFNPRTCMGCDRQACSPSQNPHKFQSTHLYGVRQYKNVILGLIFLFQSTHLYGVRPQDAVFLYLTDTIYSIMRLNITCQYTQLFAYIVFFGANHTAFLCPLMVRTSWCFNPHTRMECGGCLYGVVYAPLISIHAPVLGAAAACVLTGYGAVFLRQCTCRRVRLYVPGS